MFRLENHMPIPPPSERPDLYDDYDFREEGPSRAYLDQMNSKQPKPVDPTEDPSPAPAPVR